MQMAAGRNYQMCMADARDVRERRSPLARYLAAGRVLSNPPIIVARSGRRPAIPTWSNTSNTAASRHPSCIPTRY
jgi:hypothetical protein